MNLKVELLKGNSRAQVDRVVNYIGDNPKRFEQLIKIYLEGPYRITQRASWPMSYCVEAHPMLITPHLKTLLDYLKKPGIHDAVKRNTIRLLQFAPIPKRYYGRIADICFGYLENRKEAVAIKAFSMTVLARIIKDEPDLRKSLQLLIEDQMPYATAAFKVRARNVLKQMSPESIHKPAIIATGIN
ncbi:MAG TPA: hypothetical protein VIM65_15505 [Cyclobacteriaceae bacterium]